MILTINFVFLKLTQIFSPIDFLRSFLEIKLSLNTFRQWYIPPTKYQRHYYTIDKVRFREIGTKASQPLKLISCRNRRTWLNRSQLSKVYFICLIKVLFNLKKCLHTFNVPSLDINKFDGFKSLCIIRCECKKSIPVKSSFDNRYNVARKQKVIIRNKTSR